MRSEKGRGYIIQQKIEEEKKEIKCFRCWRVEYYKWECLNIEVERRRQKKKIVYVARLQKA